MIARFLAWLDRLVLGPRDGAPARIYARAGEVATCANGHPVAMMVRDVYVGQPMSWTDFQFVDGNKFLGSGCPKCKAAVRDGPSLYYFNGKLREFRK
jgi:hypothetical protein